MGSMRMALLSISTITMMDHDVLVATNRSDGELACLVGKHSFAYHVRLGVHIAHLLAMEVGGVACF